MSGLFPDDAVPFSTVALAQCCEREVRLRQHVYPRRVENGKMSRQKAEVETAMMQASALTLRQLIDVAKVFTEAANDTVKLLNEHGLACPASLAYAAERARNLVK